MNEPLPTGDFVMGASDIVSNSDVGWATKKARRWPDMPPDVEDPTVDGNVRKVQSPKTPKASYKSMLMGSATLLMQIDNFEENFELLDGYVMTEVVDGIPSITFSVRVQKFIERKMGRTIVVKLLGRKIGFNALLNKDDDDYHKILTWGSWVIYGQYLMVRPWSPNFSTSQNEVDIQVFWVRLPGLPKGYYSSFLIWAIRKAIGLVKRNGCVQQIEYESLSIVCFKCGLYGHNSKLCLTQKVLSPESESGKFIPVVEEAGGNPHVQMGSRILKPNNSNVGSFNYVGPNVSVDNVTMSQIYVSGRNGNTSFKPVIVHSNLDKEKHKAVQATAKENASIILERENSVFLFGDMDNGRLRSSVHALGEGDFQRDKPPDGRLVVHHPDTVELLEAIEWIVKQLERDTAGDVMADDRFGWAERYGG
ncbi:hypothetical protein Goshw_011633 [Gossypium schwendimanii]|uniref:CCHC-type domain-containing protein n=1 Tax=Gossypium schwendimanii TaxID=34291 RepID=A0A7J9N5B6_GOSSC|nr:hypothetical protein [Gossypium schwendimanii]